MIKIKEGNKELIFDEKRMDNYDLTQMLRFAANFFKLEVKKK